MRIHALAAFVAVLFSTAVAAEPVKVFILAGQSNMEGKAKLDLLNYQTAQPATADLYKHLRQDGQWVERDDVWIKFLDRKGKLTRLRQPQVHRPGARVRPRRRRAVRRAGPADQLRGGGDTPHGRSMTIDFRSGFSLHSIVHVSVGFVAVWEIVFGSFACANAYVTFTGAKPPFGSA